MEAPRAAACWHTGHSKSLTGASLPRPFTQHTVEAPADPVRVWALWTDPAAWPAFYPGLGSVQPPAEFKVGVRLGLRPASGGATQWYDILSVEPGRSFTLVQKRFLTTIRLQHRVEPCALGCRLHLRMELEGPLAWLYALLRGRTWRAFVPRLLRALAKAAQTVQV